jgi:hypothetical protein
VQQVITDVVALMPALVDEFANKGNVNATMSITWRQRRIALPKAEAHQKQRLPG